MSLNEFKVRWKLWQDESKSRLQRGEYSSDPELETACKVSTVMNMEFSFLYTIMPPPFLSLNISLYSFKKL